MKEITKEYNSFENKELELIFQKINIIKDTGKDRELLDLLFRARVLLLQETLIDEQTIKYVDNDIFLLLRRLYDFYF